MNTYNYGNRGMFLEKIINETNSYYVSINKALIFKKPTPIKVLKVSYPNNSAIIDKAVFETISTLDYNGLYRGKYIEFDAKESNNKKYFPLSNIKQHQLTHIKNVLLHGGIVFLIIFINNTFYLLKGSSLMDYISINNKKSIKIEYLNEFAYKIKEALIPRLDYLKIVDKIYFNEGEDNEKN